MRRRFKFIAFNAFFLISGTAFAIPDQQPSQLARRLLVISDQIAIGSRASLVSISVLRQDLRRAIENAPDAIWQNNGERAALVIHLLNRGEARPVQKIVAKSVDLGDWQHVIVALLAVAEGSRDAVGAMQKIDARSLDPSISAHFSLMQSIVSEPTPELAIPYLTQAKVLGAGSFVDEAASRREIEILLKLGKAADAVDAATRYLWRFGSSLFAQAVVDHLVESVIPETATTREGQIAATALFAEIPEEVRLPWLLRLGRSALLGGRLNVAAFAADLATRAAEVGSGEHTRAALVRSLAGAFLTGDVSTIDELSGMRSLQASGADERLLQATLAMLKRIHAPVSSIATANDAVTPVIELAKRTLQSADMALESDAL
jgi:hypothetical protein